MNKINLLKLEKQEITAFLWILGISLFGLISWFQANALYVDDFWRISDENVGWDFDGRPLATIVNRLLQFGKPLTDISPLPQFLGIVIFSLGIIYINRIFNVNNLILLILIGVITVLSPYNIPLHSYVLDSFTMMIATFLSILSLYITVNIEENNHNNEKDSNLQLFVNYISSILLLITASCLYQPPIAFYFVGLHFYLLFQLCKTKNYLKSIQNFFFLNSIWLLAMILYYISVKNLYKHESQLQQRSKLPELSQIPETIINNISISLKITQSDFGGTNMIWLFYLLVILVLFITLYCCLFKNNTQRIFQDKIISLGLGIVYCFIIFTSVIFPSYILADAPISNTRIYMGFTAIVCFACFFVAKFISDLKFNYGQYLLIFYYALIALLFINMTLTYGNVAYQRNLYEERIVTSLLRDVENLSTQYSLPLDNMKISFVNSKEVWWLQPNILARNAIKKYPRHNDHSDGVLKFETFGPYFKNIGDKQRFFRDNQDYYQPVQAPILKRQLYNIYLEEGDIFVITFNKKEY